MLNHWLHLLFKKRLPLSLFIVLPLVFSLTAFSSGFIALVLVEHFFDSGMIPAASRPVSLLRYIRWEVLGFTLLGLAAGFGTAFAILNPLRRLISDADKLSQGDLSVSETIGGMDEFGPLERGFHRMMSSLRRAALEQTSIGWMILDADGTILFVNSGLLDILGRRHGELHEKPLGEISGALDAEGALAARLSAILRDKPASCEETLSVRLPNGHETTLSLTAASLATRGGPILAVTLKDLSKAERIETQLQRTDRLAALGTLSAALAHEIRNPLGSIKGLAQLLEEEKSAGDKQREYARTVAREADRLGGVVSNLLRFAHPGANEFAFCNVNDLLQHALNLAQIGWSGKNIRLTRQLGQTLPLLWAEDEKLVQAFLNILINATQALGNSGEIRISTRFAADPDCIIAEICNTGGPIPDAVRDRLFEPFFTTKKDGTGLGLAITHQILTLHKGNIVCEYRDGWTVFIITFPLAKAASREPADGQPGASASATPPQSQTP